jgi:hypothetical protein
MLMKISIQTRYVAPPASTLRLWIPNQVWDDEKEECRQGGATAEDKF